LNVSDGLSASLYRWVVCRKSLIGKLFNEFELEVEVETAGLYSSSYRNLLLFRIQWSLWNYCHQWDKATNFKYCVYTGMPSISLHSLTGTRTLCKFRFVRSAIWSQSGCMDRLFRERSRGLP